MTDRPRPQSLTDLLRTSLRLYRNNLTLFVGCAALVLLPLWLLQLPIQFLRSGTLVPPLALDSPLGGLSALAQQVSIRPSGLLGWLYSLALEPLLTAALIYAADRRSRGRFVIPPESFAAVTPRWIDLVALTIVRGSLIVLLLLPAICVLLIYQSMLTDTIFDRLIDPNAAGISPLQTGLMIMLGIALLIPALIIGMRLSFAQQALILEELGPVDSTDRSWKLAEGQVWRIMGYSLAVGLVSFGLITLPLALLGWLAQTWLGSLGAAIRVVLQLVGPCLTLPLSPIASTLLYHDLRIRYELAEADRWQIPPTAETAALE